MKLSISSRAILCLALPLLLYVAGVALLGDWVIDDAGISFAYARNLGRGLGFVSQPGALPVEGFSNLLWVILLAPLARWSWFDPLLWSRLLGAGLFLATLVLVQRVLRRATGGLAAGLAVSLLLATAPPLVIWTSSGLENGLMLLLALSLWALLVERPRRFAWLAGACAGLMAATHPEALLYVAVAPLAVWLDAGSRRARVLDGARALAGWALVAAPLFLMRLAIFHLPLPHPYYAKRMQLGVWDELLALVTSPWATLTKAAELATGAAGPAGPWLLAAAAVVLWIHRRALPRWLVVAAVLGAVGGVAYVWIDPDWMRECRFGTVPIAMSALVLGGALLTVTPERWRASAAVAAALLVGLSATPRLWRFARNPTTPMAEVDRLWRAKLDGWAADLEMPQASAFLADVGAPLWSSSLRIIDAAGLCEPAIVVTLKNGGRSVDWKIGNPAFYDWFFETAKPTFVALHDFWTVTTELDHDPRFIRDYAAIDAYWDRYAEKTFDVHSRSGMWVRRDALKTPDALDKLRARRSAPPTEPLAWRIQDRLFAPEWDDGDANRSILLLQRLVAQSPNDAALLRTLAEKLDGASRVDEARALWTRVAELADNSAAGKMERLTAHDRLHGFEDDADHARWMNEGTEALYDRHDPATAIDRFRRILAQDPGHYGANFQLARALDAAGRRVEAIAAWNIVVEMAKRAGDGETTKLATEALNGTHPR